MNKIFIRLQKGREKALINVVLTIMRVFIFFIIFGLGSVYANSSYSQVKININVQNVSIEELFKEIQNKSEYIFFYEDNVIDKDVRVSIKLNDAMLSEILNASFNNIGLDYTISDRQVVVKTKKTVAILQPASVAEQQKFSISGVINDNNGFPLPGASVLEKGTTNGTQTDFNGNFKFEVSSSKATLEISYMGFKTKDIPLNGKSTITINLEEDAASLDEVVVIGYGTVKKSDLTGSVSSVDTKGLTKTQNTSIAQAIQGRAAGVVVTKSSGRPGATPTVRIRGTGTVNNADPLYIVDGIPINDISSINMEDAKSIEVLKDASATAIYGSRAANGVVLITTKTGNKGETVISYKTFIGSQSRVDNLNVLNAEQWATLHNEANMNDGTPGDPYLSNPSDLQSYNWKDLIYQSAIMQNHQLSISGGSDLSTFYISAGFVKQDGIIKSSSYERTNFRVNNTYQIKPKIKVGHNIQYAKSKDNSLPEYGNSESRTSFIGYVADPVSPIYNSDGSFSPSKYNSFIGNPLGVVKYRTQETIKESFLANLFLEADLMKGLKFRSSYGLEINNSKSDNFTPIHNVSPAFSSDVTTYSLGRSENRVMILSNTLNYNTIIAEKHSVNAMLGQEIQDLNSNNVSASRNEIPESVESPTLGAGAIYTASNDGTISNSKLSSFFGRLNYNFDERYLITGTYRVDGSSRFGDNNRWAKFPSLALGWNIHNESFYNLKEINQVKFRLGWGETGNQNIPGTATYNILNIGTNAVFANDETSLGVAPLRFGNPDLKWETTITKNIGADFALLSNALTFSVDYFIKSTKDMLLETPVATSSGYEQNPYTNVGDIENKGFELTANYKKQIKDFYFNIGGNIATLKNKVIKLASGDGVIQAGQASGGLSNMSRTQAGHPLASFYGYEMIGIFQNQEEIDNYPHIAGTKPGDVKYKDINGAEGDPDGIIDNKDMTYIGSPFPDFTYGLNIDMKYKQFDFTAFFQGSQGNDIFDATDANLMTSTITNFRDKMLNRWTGDGTSNSIPRVTHKNQTINSLQSSRYIKDGSYLRLKNVQLGYTFPEGIVKNVNDIHIYIAAQNLFTITNYDGLDPELGIDASRNQLLAIGIDEGRYPSVRTFSLGLNINF
ncbi:TonB-dependent receptor [Lutibacter citreus]|uniref:TonB-dependent receptor n=1 Tax=Lutibacter citreus TaxID=2138210 RepID=UPI000DBE29E1|nr:TonB-dependent receptor [Lutibacter citreus]